jgi:Ca-activated chloride channel family protein
MFRLATTQESVAALEARPQESGDPRADLRAVKALFGARRVLGLEYLIGSGLQGTDLERQLERLGYDADEVQVDGRATVYAENAREAARAALKALLVQESLAYGLVCSETAFVAVRSEAGKRVEGRVIVPSALPSGWSDQFLSMGPGAPVAFAAGAAPKSVALRTLAASPADGKPRFRRGGRTYALRTGRGLRPAARSAVGTTVARFDGVPAFEKGQAMLIDQTVEQDTTLSQITVEVRAPSGALDPELALWVYVRDLAVPCVRIRLADLERLGGKRPLNLRVRAGEVVRIVLVDPRNAWAAAAPSIAASLLS